MSTPIAGLLVPLDMFRISQFAAMFSELLASKARNILDAELVVTRHPEAPLFLMQIAGSVIDGNPETDMRDYALKLTKLIMADHQKARADLDDLAALF